jgi:hypothetical protein
LAAIRTLRFRLGEYPKPRIAGLAWLALDVQNLIILRDLLVHVQPRGLRVESDLQAEKVTLLRSCVLMDVTGCESAMDNAPIIAT